MPKGSRVGLRARHEDDIPILRAELHDDVVDSSRAEGGPWRPIVRGLQRLQIETLSDNAAGSRRSDSSSQSPVVRRPTIGFSSGVSSRVIPARTPS